MENYIKIEDYVDIVQYNISDETEDIETITPQIIIGDENAVEVKICQDTDEFTLLEVTIVEDPNETVEKQIDIDNAGYVTEYMTHENMMANRIVEDPNETVEKQIDIDNAGYVTEYMAHENMMAYRIVEEPNETVEKQIDIDNAGYFTEYMTHENMMAYREEKKKDSGYAEAKYKCESCIIIFYSQCGLDKHNEFVHLAKEGTKLCKVCQSYVVYDSFNNHMYNHYIKNVCQTCGHADDDARWVRKHVRSHYSDISVKKNVKMIKMLEDVKGKPRIFPVPGTSKYRCLECDKKYDSMVQAKRHYKYQHIEKALLTCKKCKKQFSSRLRLAKHLQLCNEAKEVHTCEQCNEEFPSMKILNKHQLIHAYPYHCSICFATFIKKGNLYAHGKKMHSVNSTKA